MTALIIGGLALLGLVAGFLLPAVAERVRQPRALRHQARLVASIDDLWSVVTAHQIADLQPETAQVAQSIHEQLWHSSEKGRRE